MMRETSGIVFLAKPVGVALTVDTLVVEAHDGRDLRVLVDVSEDALPDRRVLLHLPPLFERERSWLLEQAWRKPDLADVVDESAEIRMLLHLDRKTHPLRDVSRIDRNGGGVSGGVSIPRVQRRDQRGSELKVRTLKRLICR